MCIRDRVYNVNLGSYQYKTAGTAVVSPQGVTGLDPNFTLNMSLVSPQANPAVDFSAYPAQDGIPTGLSCISVNL